ncbi:putative beta-1 [Forsythia ovata]|uniref:Hexosyltransferase n=1 Tax=Forsythia ovata TaxID=205694 RepID=A0ABD1XEF4_9LAMI
MIEQNTCCRMQWGSAQRCEGWKSRADEETVDGQVKCEKWIRDDDSRSEESKATWWLKRLIGRTKMVTVDWPYPFVQGKLIVLTLSAGLERYHINVDGRVLLLRMPQDCFSMAKYIMKCDDDNFVRLDAVMKEVKKVPSGRGLYIGNMNYYHKPLRHGKCAVTYETLQASAVPSASTIILLTTILPPQDKIPGSAPVLTSICYFMDLHEWPEEDYPPYANGPGCIVSSDIAQYIVSDFEKHKLRSFKR